MIEAQELPEFGSHDKPDKIAQEKAQELSKFKVLASKFGATIREIKEDGYCLYRVFT